jgi:hypothetical protein
MRDWTKLLTEPMKKKNMAEKSGAAAGGWRSKTTEGNWADGSNARLGRTGD